ncbi:MAG: ABC transporter substrate-binding protein, partial [Deltaproteobacteria bacterium]|nr:ABC transporter substrate-binding protein [Deltaproteobacteria bacterium]
MKTVVIAAVVCVLFLTPSRLYAQKVTVLYSNATFTGTALFVAKDAGLCQQRGIDLELVLGGGSAPTVSAVIGGHVEFVHGSASSLLNAALQGGPVVIVAKVMGPPPYKLVGGMRVKNVGDLKGKKIGVNRFGGAPDFLLRYVLAKSGLDIQKDVTILQTGDPAARLTSLFTGAMDATMLLVPEEKVAVEKGYPVIVDFAALRLPYVNIVLGANKKFL